jgi:Conjugative transposon protein TcpC
MITDQARTAGHPAENAAQYAGGQAPGHGPVPFAQPAPPAAATRPKPRRGSGGRWLVWSLRVVVWAILLLIGYRGIAAIVTSYTGSSRGSGASSGPVATRHGPGPGHLGGRSGAGGSAGTVGRPGGTAASGAGGPALQPSRGFPVALAQAFVMDFGQVYLNVSPASAGQRASALAGFVPPGASAQFGWNGTGTQTLEAEQVVATRVLSAHVAVVTLLAEVNGKLIELGVPVYAAGGGIVVSAKPALLPPPPKPAIPSAAHAVPADPVAEASLARELPSFFRAFAGSSVVRSPSLVAGPSGIPGLNGVVTYDGIASVSVPAGGGARRHIAVTVVWRTAGQVRVRTSTVANAPADIAMTYAMTVVRRSGNWYVVSIGAAAAMAGPTS